jgi:hypothetical protein
MPIARFEMPDGRIGRFEVPEGTSPEKAQQLIAGSLGLASPQQEDEPRKRKGIGAAFSKGVESLLGSGQTTLESPFGVNKAAERALQRNEALDKKYEEQVSLDKLKEAYEKRGLTGAGGELLRQVPLALAEQAPNILASLGSARTGAMLGAPLGPYGAGIGALGGALFPSALQLFGSNVERQAAEQKQAGVPTDISTSKALAATAIQAPLDVAATYIPLGGKIVGKMFGPEVEKILMRGGTQAAEKLAQESFAKTLGKGLGVGALAEIPTEVAQQVLERAQAGLSLVSKDALEEYGKTAYQVSLLAPIGGAGRFVDKSAAKSQMALEQKEKDNKLAQEQQAAAQEALLAQKNEEQQKQLQAQQLKTGDLFGEPIVTGGKGKKLVEGAVSPLTGEPELFRTGVNEKKEPTYGVKQAVPETRTATEREAEANKPPEITPQEIFRQHDILKKHVVDLQDRVAKAATSGDIETLSSLSPQLTNAQKALVESTNRVKQTAPIEQAPEIQTATLKGQLTAQTTALKKAGDLGDFEAIAKINAKINEIQSKLKELPQGEDLIAQSERLKNEAVVKETEQMQQQQEDLFAQVEATKPKATEVVNDTKLKTAQEELNKAYAENKDPNEIYSLIEKLNAEQKEFQNKKAEVESKNQPVITRYQQGLQELEDAYAAGASEKTINNLIDKLREASLEKEASRARGISGEEQENQVQRVERVKRSLEEAKNQYNESKSDEERAEALKNIGALQDRLATAQADRAQGRPEVAEKEAYNNQEEAKRDAIETVRQILSGEYFNSRNVDVASSLKPQLENKIIDAGKAYGREAVNEINAVRAQKKIKQESLSTDDALKLATRIQGRFNYLAKNPTYLAEKVRETNLKTFEDSLERIKKDFMQGKSKIRKVTPVLKQERNPIEMLRREQKKKKPNTKVVEGLKREIEAGKKEDARIAAEKEKAEIKEPEGVNPDQGNLFAANELEPIAVVRATTRNLLKLSETQSKRFKEAQARAERLLKQAEEQAKEKNKIKPVDKSFVEVVKKQRDFVKEIQNAKEIINNLRSNALELWAAKSKVAASLKEVNMREAAIEQFNKKIEEEQASENPSQNIISDLKKYIAKNKQAIKELTTTNVGGKPETINLQERLNTLDAETKQRNDAIDSLHKRANEIENANIKDEKELLDKLEEKLKSLQAASPEAKKIQADAEKMRAEIGKAEAEAKKSLEEQIKYKREIEERQAKELAKLPSKRQEIIATNVKAPGAEEKVTRKQIIQKSVPKTDAERLDEAKEAAAEGARQMAELKKMQNTSLKLKEVRKVESKLKKDLASKVEQVKADTEKLIALESKAKETNAKEDKQALDKFKKEINVKNLGQVVNTLEKNLKLLKGVGSDVEKALVIAGNKPQRLERKKPLKTGVSKVEKDFKEAIDSEKYAETGLDKDTYVDMVIDIRNGDIDFRIEENDSNTPPITKAEAEDVLSKIKMPKGLKVFVLDKIPADLKELFESMGHKSNKVKGWVSAKGDVYIVAENHTSIPDLNETIAHELIGHVGVEALLGEQGMRSLIRKIISQEGGVLELAKKLGVFNEVYGTYASARRQGLSDYEAQAAAVREMIAHTAEKAPNRSMTQKLKDFIKLVVAHVRDALRKRGVNLDTSTSDIYKIIHTARTNFENITPGAFVNADGAIKFNVARPKANAAFEGVLNSTNGIVAQQKPLKDRIFGSGSGLVYETKYVDRFAPISKALESIKDSLKATQTMYYLRMHDQRMAFTSEVMSNGPLDLVPAKDGKGFIVESQKGTSLIDVINALKTANVGDVNATNRVFTMYLLAKRAADPNVGLAKLNYSGKITQEMLDYAIDTVEKDAATKASFEKAAAIYAKYNEGLINFAVKSGALNKEDAAAMLKNKNYVPFYRVRSDGSVFLEIGGAPAVKIGNLAEQPYLHELVGGDQPIFDVFTSALQNTSMLTDMALRNIATKNTANTLADLGLLKTGDSKKDNGIYRGGQDVKGTDIIRFKSNGENYYARVNSEAAGVPSELLVKGLEGVNTSLPNIVKMLNVPSTILRKWVTRNPAYMLRQLVRDPLNGVVTAGLDTTPIVSSMREVIKMVKGKSEGEALLQGRGILGGQVLTGTTEDQQAMLKALLSGEKGWDYRMAQLDQLSVKGDAATRVVMYNNYIKQGLSEMEATLATLEAMNFSKRGISASLFQISTMVPFMNAQIQGLNVLWKSFNGKMPFDQKLKIKQKAVQRSLMLVGSTMLYAAMMQDDEAYKNANDDEKYGNWFVYTPFSDEPIKIPIPFEVGLLFKAVPEALVNTIFGDAKARDTMSAIGKQAFNSLPNVGPQAIKPALEAAINYSFYTGRGIESDRLMQYEPGERYEDRTSEIAKLVGGALNISPVKIEYLIKGYFGSIPLAVASMANPIIRSGEGGEKPESRGMLSSDTPLLGTFFQPVDAGGLINKAYKDMDEIDKVTQTYKKMVKENRDAEAEAYLDTNADIIGMGSMAGRFRKKMGDLTNYERAIRTDPDMTAGEKRKELDEIKQLKIETAKYFSSVRG